MITDRITVAIDTTTGGAGSSAGGGQGLGGGEVTGLTPSNTQSPTYATTDIRAAAGGGGGGASAMSMGQQSTVVTPRSPSHSHTQPPPAPHTRDGRASRDRRDSNGDGRRDSSGGDGDGRRGDGRRASSDGGRGDSRSRSPHRRGLPILNRPEYYTDPPMAALREMEDSELARVEVSHRVLINPN